MTNWLDKYKASLMEVAEPTAGDEQWFKNLHTDNVDRWGHPVALDHQFTGEIIAYNPETAHSNRPADYVFGEDEAVYDSQTRQDMANWSVSDTFLENVTEAVMAGSLKLQDGSSVNVSKDDALKLNTMFESLSPSNKIKMESLLVKGQDEFSKILSFAKVAL